MQQIPSAACWGWAGKPRFKSPLSCECASLDGLGTVTVPKPSVVDKVEGGENAPHRSLFFGTSPPGKSLIISHSHSAAARKDKLPLASSILFPPGLLKELLLHLVAIVPTAAVVR